MSLECRGLERDPDRPAAAGALDLIIAPELTTPPPDGLACDAAGGVLRGAAGAVRVADGTLGAVVRDELLRGCELEPRELELRELELELPRL